MDYMNVEVTLHDAKLIASSVSDKQANKIIEGFFKSISPKPKVTNAKTEAPKPVKTKDVVAESIVTTFEPLPFPLPFKKPTPLPKQPQGDGRPKALPVVDSNKNMTQQPFAGLSELLEKPPETIGAHTVKWVSEGIKENEKGEKLYRTHYWCVCGYSGKRYVPTYYNSCKCHDCGTHLAIEDAVPGEDLKQDKDGAFFIARELYESEGEL